MIVLPLIAAGLLAAFFYGLSDDRQISWRASIAYTSVIWGTLLVVILESLSLLHAMHANTVASAWVLAIVVISIIGWRKACYQRAWIRIRTLQNDLSWVDWFFLSLMVAITLTLFLVAALATPNNTDSLQYHLTRVSHWIQNASLRHFATAYPPNVMHPIWSEAAILNFRLLAGVDRFASLVQWIAGLGLMVVMAEASAVLGVSKKGRWLAVAFVLSAPQFLLQATSTQNDLVVSFWAVIVAWVVLLGKKRKLSRFEQVTLALAVALGVLTKFTFAIYVVPFLIWHFLPYMKFAPETRKRFLIEAGLIFVAVLVINSGYWGRNVRTYGNPLGSSQVLTSHSNNNVDPRILLAGAIDHAVLNFATPSETVTKNVIEGVRDFREALGLERSDFVVFWSWNHEDIAGNPIHFLLLMMAMVGMVSVTRKDGFILPVRYALACLASLLLLALILEASAFSIRYQIGILALWSPVLAFLADRWLRPRWQAMMILALLLLTIPWLLFNRSRPLVGLKPRTSIDSILEEERSVVLFANWTGLRNDYADTADFILGSYCEHVGMVLDSHDLEYPFWWLLQAPESGIHLHLLNPASELAYLVDDEFQVCVVVCTVCGGREAWDGLPLASSFGDINVYGSPELLPGIP